MMREIRKLYWDDLRNLCIRKGWYTKGTSTEYETMLNMSEKENIATEDIVAIAQDIMDHSDDDKMELTSYCFEIAKICNTFFEEE